MNILRMQEFYNGEEYLNKLRARAETIQLLNADPLTRYETFKQIYANDFEKFCEDFLFLIIPEYGDAIKPFFLFEYQKEINEKFKLAEEYGGDVEILVDKPRGMGIT